MSNNEVTSEAQRKRWSRGKQRPESCVLRRLQKTDNEGAASWLFFVFKTA